MITRALILSLLSLALALPASAQPTWHKDPPPAVRSELIDSATVLPEVDGASLDPAHLTPLPVEMPEAAAHLPEGVELLVPFVGEFEITQGYGYGDTGWTHRTIGNENSANDFFALDFGAPTGTPVLATAAGRVVTSNLRGDSYGNYVVIDHGEGLSSVYAHMSSREFEVMDASPEVWVEAGQLIGHSGNSGTRFPHLHFAVHTGARRSSSGADVGGLATVPEPLGGHCGLRGGQVIRGAEAPTAP
ncbi:M23 family metallopeptidase [Candidatus Sumerlaeota bacterium]|nr:M23 family metallopeptidase [Candidatus Sumerlaeota bacterium]